MAIIAPILLIMFIGVFEVGWAIRGFLVLANVNRETVRYSVKNGVLDFSVKDPSTVGYDVVLDHSENSLAEQLPLDFDEGTANSTVIMSHFVVDTMYPCVKTKNNGDVKVPYEFDPNCDCNETDPDAAQWFTRDDLIAHPGNPAYPQYVQTYGLSQTTHLGDGDYEAFAKELALENNQFNCNVFKNGGTIGDTSSNNLIIAEAFYDQPQLLGLPFISNSVTDPIPFYTHTAMRIVTSRDADTTDTVGPTCELLPITFPEDSLINPQDPPEQKIDAYEGSASGNFGWLYWNSSINETNGINYIEEALQNPRLSMTDFTADEDDPDYPDDHSITIGDHIAGRTGVGNSSDIEDWLEYYTGKTVVVPVYEEIGAKGGAGASYKISHFARVTITQVCLPRNSCIDPNTGKQISGSNKLIQATFLEYVDDACSEPVIGENEAPVAVDDAKTTPNDTPVTINVLSNDSDPDGDTLTISSITQPSKGSVTNNGDGTLTYTPKNNASGVGIFTFEYTISDGHGNSATATVTITVTDASSGTPSNNPPVAVNDSASTSQNTAVTINVLSNDSDADGDSLTVANIGAAGHGSVVNNGNGTITYTPANGFVGSDDFTYTITDGQGGSATATVYVTVQSNNSPPVAQNDNGSTTWDKSVAINVLTNDSDPDGDSLALVGYTDPGNGTVTNNGGGTFTYKANDGFVGSDTFTYQISDGNGGLDTGTVTVNVTAPVNNPPVANGDSGSVEKNKSVTINVVGNDTDADGDSLSVQSVSAASQGTVSYSGGSVTYTANWNASGSDSFTYTVSDGKGGTDTATVVITIIVPNNRPNARDDNAGYVKKNDSVTLSVLSNDWDPDGDTLTIISVSTSDATINSGGQSLTYRPTSKGWQTFTYTISDGRGGTDTATVSAWVY